MRKILIAIGAFLILSATMWAITSAFHERPVDPETKVTTTTLPKEIPLPVKMEQEKVEPQSAAEPISSIELQPVGFAIESVDNASDK